MTTQNTVRQKDGSRAGAVCSIEGCDGPVRARLLCNAHYLAARNSGALQKLPRETLEERIWRRIDRSGRCWLWTGNLEIGGYATLTISENGRKIPRRVHRIMYEMFRGKIPPGMKLDHLCRVRHCVNPNHLEIVTDRENILRGNGVSAKNYAKTHCKRGHSLAGYNLIVRSGGGRQCRTCVNAGWLRRKRLRREHTANELSCTAPG